MSTLPASSSKSECRIAKKEATDQCCAKCSRSQPSLRDKAAFFKNAWKLKACKCKCLAKTTSTTELRAPKESKCSCHKNTSTSNLAEQKYFDFSHIHTECCPTPNSERPKSSKDEEPSCSGLKDEEILWNRTENTCSFLPQCCGSWEPQHASTSACCPVSRDPLLPSTCYEQHPCAACCYPGYLTSYSESYKCRPVPPPPRPVMQPWNTWPGQCCEKMSAPAPYPTDCYNYMPERCSAGGGPAEIASGDSDAVSEHSETTSEPQAPTTITPMCYLCPCCNTTNGLHCMTNDSPMKIMAQEVHGRYGVYNFQPYFQHYTSGCGME